MSEAMSKAMVGKPYLRFNPALVQSRLTLRPGPAR